MHLTSKAVCSALACQNGLSSNLALVSTSDCALHALDIAAGCPVATLTAAHSRPIEKLAFVPASPLVNTHTAAVACNTLLASSKGNCVRLWDVRSMKCIRQFGSEQHSKTGTCAAAVSPCGCMVACGAADPAEVHTYDVRMAGILQVLQQVRTCRIRMQLSLHIAVQDRLQFPSDTTQFLHKQSFHSNLHTLCRMSLQSPLLWNL